MKRFWKQILVVWLLMLVTVSVGMAPKAFAATITAGGSGGGKSYSISSGSTTTGGCGWFGTWADCGAVWMYYELSSDRVSIPDVKWASKDETWLPATTDDIGGTCQWKEGEKAGQLLDGFYHYGALGRVDGAWGGYQWGTTTMNILHETATWGEGYNEYDVTDNIKTKTGRNPYVGYNGVIGATAKRIVRSTEVEKVYNQLIQHDQDYGTNYTGKRSFYDTGWFCWDKDLLGESGTWYSRSSVQYEGNGKASDWDGEATYDSGETVDEGEKVTVTFYHDIAITTDPTKLSVPASTTFNVETTVTPDATFELGKTDVTSKTISTNVSNFSAEGRYFFTNGVIGLPVTVTVPAGASEVTICQTISYSTKNFTIDEGAEAPKNAGDSGKSKACITFKVEGCPTPIEHYGKSGVYNGNTNDYRDTGVVQSPTTRSLSASLTLPTGGTVSDYLVFTHNVYASAGDEEVAWSIARTVNGAAINNSSSDYSLSVYLKTTESGSGKTETWLDVNGTGYYPIPRTVQDNHGDWYLRRSDYTVTFKKAGIYKFCEALTVDGVKITEVCKSIEVKPSSTDTLSGYCSSTNWIPASYTTSQAGLSDTMKTEGKTSVLSKVWNGRTDGGSAGWHGVSSLGESGSGLRIRDPNSGLDVGTTYARPWDTTQWVNCYYPGVQYFAKSQVLSINTKGNYVGTHANESGCSCTTNDYIDFDAGVKKVGGTWSNLYGVTTTSPAGLGSSNSFNSGELGSGSYMIRSTTNSYLIQSRDVESTFYDEISTTASPLVTWLTDEGKHSWYPSCCSSSECGTHTCCSKNGGCRQCCNTCTVTRTHCNSEIVGHYTANTSTPKSKSEVKIPYNFQNSVKVQLNSVAPGASNLVYAGERANVSNAGVTVGCRTNSTVGGAVSGCVNDAAGNPTSGYATIVRDAKVQLIAYVTARTDPESENVKMDFAGDLCNAIDSKKQCAKINERTGDLNDSNSKSSLYGSTLTDGLSGTNGTFSNDYNVFDASAGDYFCVVIGVYPATSGGDTNMDRTGDKKWAVSKPSCKIIAKKPTFEVVGGSLYANGAVAASTMVKQNFYDKSDYTPVSLNNAVVLGSWVEEGILANGAVNGLASGAALGKSTTVISKGSAEAGVTSGKTMFCANRTNLTFANSGMNANFDLVMCDNGGDFAGYAGIDANLRDRASLVSYWVPEGASGSVSSGSTPLNSSAGQPVTSATGREIRYLKLDGGLTLLKSDIGLNETYIVRAGGDVTVNGDIRYTGDSMSSTGQVPKVVIYAENIRISCNAEEVDAILIAEENINTCYEATENVNETQRSKQLTIRGVVIANTLTLPRTFGAAAGDKSGLPAELINYDTSSILWGRFMAGSAESDTMSTVYQHELAPRY